MEQIKHPENFGQAQPFDSEPIEITGIIIPVEWDTHAVPTRFALSGYDEQEYIIENFFSLHRFPQTLLRKKIRVLAHAGEMVNKRKKIIISQYDITEVDLVTGHP